MGLNIKVVIKNKNRTILLLIGITLSILVKIIVFPSITQYDWKYIEGYHIGDYIQFNGYVREDNGKLFIADTLAGEIESIRFKTLKIISNNGEIGYYIAK